MNPEKLEISGLSFLIQPGDRIRHQIQHNKFERESLRTAIDHCRTAKGTMIDVGGFIGLYTVPMRMLGISVQTFEPYEIVRKELQSNLELNAVAKDTQSVVYPIALSDSEGEKTLYTIKDQPTSSSSLRRHPVHNHEFKVPVKTLDSYGFENVSLIKIDTEEHEHEVIRGGMQTITRYLPMIIAESLNDERNDILMNEILPMYTLLRRMDERNLLLVPK